MRGDYRKEGNTMESKKYTYWRSTFTGQCYKWPEENGVMPGKGWEPIHEETYVEWCIKNRMPI